MSRKSGEDTAQKLLRVYAILLTTNSPESVTLSDIAKRAGVSKGGLLYHYPSKQALATALVAWFTTLNAEYCTVMAEAPEGPAQFYLRTSNETNSDLDLVLLATAQLANTGDEQAVAALHDGSQQHRDVIGAEITDPALLELVMLVADGMYYRASLSEALPTPLVQQQHALHTPALQLLTEILTNRGGLRAANS